MSSSGVSGKKRRIVLLVAGVLGFVLLVMGLRECAPAHTTHYIRDTEGRIVIYHGVNVASNAKHAENHLPWQTRDDFARLNAWGFNLVRYLVFWEAMEPEDGGFNEEYIAQTLERIRWLDELGIDVILDVHQDLYAKRFTGNGFPDWMVHDGGRKFTPREPWNLNYLEPAVMHSFDTFWRTSSMKARYVDMLEYLLRQVDKQRNIVGIEVMNEPWPWLGLRFEKKALSTFYEDIQAMHRQNGFRIPLVFEPANYTAIGLRSGLSFAPSSGSILAVHDYDIFLHVRKVYGRLTRWLMPRNMRVKVNIAESLHMPLLITEFGVAPDMTGFDDYLNDTVYWMNRYHIGWTYYSYDKSSDVRFGIVDDNGQATPILEHLIQVYPQRIAGKNPEYTVGEKCFDLAYDPLDIDAPTIIFIPRSLSVTQLLINGKEQPFDPNSLYVTHANSSAKDRQTIHIEWK
ncbi:MAG TPA: cellulase family glycosylhydrolase [Candidatus Hydrogenedentes bacterium]|nr:cellulase family glycosylhydrolase [Candidatus Hydrogenedentota bacterium]